MIGTKDPAAVESVFKVIKGSKAPYKLGDFVRSATNTKNPEAVSKVFKWYDKVIKGAVKALPVASMHMLGPVVLPKEALDKLDFMKEKKLRRKT